MDRLKALEIAIEHLISKYFGASALAEIKALIDVEVKKLEGEVSAKVDEVGKE